MNKIYLIFYKFTTFLHITSVFSVILYKIFLYFIGTYPTIPKSLIYSQSPNRTLNLIFFNFNNFGDFNNRLKCLKINSGIGSVLLEKWSEKIGLFKKPCFLKKWGFYTLHRHNWHCFCHFSALSNLIGWQHISPLVEMTKAQFMAVLSIASNQ